MLISLPSKSIKSQFALCQQYQYHQNKVAIKLLWAELIPEMGLSVKVNIAAQNNEMKF